MLQSADTTRIYEVNTTQQLHINKRSNGESSGTSTPEEKTQRRRSTFYVPLIIEDDTEQQHIGDAQNNNSESGGSISSLSLSTDSSLPCTPTNQKVHKSTSSSSNNSKKKLKKEQLFLLRANSDSAANECSRRNAATTTSASSTKSKVQNNNNINNNNQILNPKPIAGKVTALLFERTHSTLGFGIGGSVSGRGNRNSNSKKKPTASKVKMSPPCGFNWSMISDSNAAQNSDTDDDDLDSSEAIMCSKKIAAALVQPKSPSVSTTAQSSLRSSHSSCSTNDHPHQTINATKMKRYGIVLQHGSDDSESFPPSTSSSQSQVSHVGLGGLILGAIAPRTHFNEDNDIVMAKPGAQQTMSSSNEATAMGNVYLGVCDDDDSEISRMQTNTSTPIKLMKSRSRTNILSVPSPPIASQSSSLVTKTTKSTAAVTMTASSDLERSLLSAVAAAKSNAVNSSSMNNSNSSGNVSSTIATITLRAKSKTLPQNLSPSLLLQQGAAMQDDAEASRTFGKQHAQRFGGSTVTQLTATNSTVGNISSSSMANSCSSNKSSSGAATIKLQNSISTASIITHTFPPKNLFLLKSTSRLGGSSSSNVNKKQTAEKHYCNSDSSLQTTPLSTSSKSKLSSSSAGMGTAGYPLQHSMSATTATASLPNAGSQQQQVTSPAKKSLSFIRRAHSTKLSRSNSLLKSIATQHQHNIHNHQQQQQQQNHHQQSHANGGIHANASANLCGASMYNAADYCGGSSSWCRDFYSQYDVCPLTLDELDTYFQADRCTELICERFKVFDISINSTICVENGVNVDNRNNADVTPVQHDEDDDDAGHHSDTSYEKACRRGSAPTTPILGQKQNQTEHNATSRFTNFFSKRSNPLKRTKSVTKLERTKRGSGGLRGSRSHESLLSSHAVMSTIDLSCTGAVGVAPVHQSVLGRRHCFQVRGGPRGERYYSCGSRQERDLWIYSLRKSIAPNAEHTRRTDNSLKMWVYEAKNLPPKKKYFCELHLDKTLYGRTSVKLQTDLLFWGEYFDFPDIPEINVITVNVFREMEKKKKRDKYQFVGSVKIPIHEVTTRAFCEDWYPILSEKTDSLNRNGKDVNPTLRIKCRFQSTDILPINVYASFLAYLKDNYKRVCETLEPVIGVKAKEDIGQALVLLMHAQGLAGAFLTDVVALDLLRVGDQRLTFRGNSLATKSMEAFLKLTGEQYLQDTLSGPINEIIQSDRDCEVDPTKATGSLQRQQASLRSAVRNAWQCIYESHKHFPPQLRACFATFRERLQQIGRQDMADNLISASIFLRFLCPAILSPSLFNITNELPSSRATRNLTLVAKTLQTLANFTRFQGKENFMEFLNDFLELEADRMQQFLECISTQPEHSTPESILDWPGYIDQGKQLSILHTLLSDCITKLPEARQRELDPLQHILDEITKAKEHNIYLLQQQQQLSSSTSHSHLVCENQENRNPEANQQQGGTLTSAGMLQQQQAQLAQPQHAVVTKPVPAERGIMRGVLTPSSLEKNIFRYNDPTVNGVLQQQQLQQQQTSQQLAVHPHLDRRHSNSQSSIVGTQYVNSTPVLQHAQSQSSMASSSLNGSSNNLLISANIQHHCPPAPQTSAVNTIERLSQPAYTSSYSGSMNASITSSNLSHNGNSTANGNGGCSDYSETTHSRTLPRSNNNAYDDLNGDFIQIDTNSAFVRKSPTPMIKSSGLGAPGTRCKQLNNSNLSLTLSDAHATPSKLNLGIPDHSNQSAHKLHSGNIGGAAIYQRPIHAAVVPRDINPNSNMPMNLEDLADLFKYAEEHSVEGGDNSSKAVVLHQHNKEQLSAKNSHCSSGYQSISTNPSPSQSSSPVDSGQLIKMGAAPLAFKNPTYQLQGQHAQQQMTHRGNNTSGVYQPAQHYISNRNKPHTGGIVAARAAFLNSGGIIDATLTPSSSDERLSSDNYHGSCGYNVISKPLRSPPEGHLETHRSMSGGSNSSASSSKKINMSAATAVNTRLPYNNTSYKREDIYGGGGVMQNNNNNSYYNVQQQQVDLHNTTSDSQQHENKTYMGGGITPQIAKTSGTTAVLINANAVGGIVSAGGRYQRRLSLDSARTLSDSSTDTEGHCQAQEGKRRRHPRNNTGSSSGVNNSNTPANNKGGNHHEITNQVASNIANNYDQNGEIQLLQETLDTLRHTLDRDEAELRDSSDELFALNRSTTGSASAVGNNGANNLSLQSESTMRSIIDRLITMEEELRREQLNMSLALSHKQRVIEEQGQQIAALDAANSRLLNALTALRQRYETQQQQAPKNPKAQ